MVCLEAALKYVDMGLSVIPIQPHSKKPLGAWEQYQGRIADSEEIKKWFAENPDANIAIVTGAVSNVVVIDLDSFEAKEALKKELSVFDIQFVPRSRTANGFHLFFKHPGGIVRNRTGILRKIDVRADGGYVVAPPSKHPSGRTYIWEVPLTPAAPELPPELYDLIVRNGMRQNGNGNKESGRITSGGRNARLTSFAGSMRRRGMTKEAILAALLVENESRCDPPLEEQEVEKIAKSISGYDLGVAKEIKHSTDLGNAQRLVRLHGEDLRYCYQLGWLVWDGRRWKRSEEGEIEQRAKDTVRSIYTEAASCPDEATRKALATHAKKSESEARIKAMISLAQSEPGIPIRIDELDHNPWLLNVKNGTLDLKGGDLRDHSLIRMPFDRLLDSELALRLLDLLRFLAEREAISERRRGAAVLLSQRLFNFDQSFLQQWNGASKSKAGVLRSNQKVLLLSQIVFFRAVKLPPPSEYPTSLLANHHTIPDGMSIY